MSDIISLRQMQIGQSGRGAPGGGPREVKGSPRWKPSEKWAAASGTWA